jgi:hypothetical protein
MRNNKKTLSLLLVMLAVAMATATAALRSHVRAITATQEGADDTPVADVSATALKDEKQRAKRQARNKHYDENGLVVEPKSVGGDIVRRSESFRKMPALPASQSDAVVIGRVTDAQSYLSEDKSGVYTEFTIRVDDILKHDGSLTPGTPLVAQRVGGRVRFASGIVQRYRIDHQGMPRAGRRYVLFLKKTGDEEVYTILTGYELRGGRVHPVDGVVTSGEGSELPQFVPYKDADEMSFLAAIRDAITKS